MSKLSNENLFLLEFLVDQVTIKAECDCGTPGELCVSFQFLDSTILEICENDFTPDESNDQCTKTGKSCLFSLTPIQIEECMRNFDVCVTVLKKIPEQDNTVIGNVLVSITNLFIELTNDVSNNDDDESPTAKTLRDCFDIFDTYGEIIGNIGMYIRMSCFGKLIITQFQMNLDDNSVLFKDKEGQSLYRYRKVKHKQDGYKQDGNKQGGDLKACSKVYFNKSNKLKNNPNCPEKSCYDDKSTANLDDPWESPNCPSESCFDNSRPKNSVNFDSNPNYAQPPCFGMNSTRNMPKDEDSCFNPNCRYFDDNSDNRRDARQQNCPQQSCFDNQQPGYGPQNFGNNPGFYGPSSLEIGKSMVPCNECLTSTPNAGYLPPPSVTGNMSAYQNARPLSPCNECVSPSPCDNGYSPRSLPANPPCGQCGQMSQNQFSMGIPQINNISPIPSERTEQINSNGDSRMCPGFQDNTISNINNQNDNRCCARTTTPEAKATTTIDCNDPNKETFILRIGKKSDKMDERKNKLEVELCTPKCTSLKPKPTKETRECQYDIKDIPSDDKKKGKGKGKKGGKDKKGKGKGKKKK